MGFYYFSLIGWFILLAAGGVMAGIFLLVWTKIAGRKLTGRVLAVSIPIAVLVPWSEELWIAWNFGQACKDAGTHVKRTVEVEGFYDDTGGWGARQILASGYRFMESRDVLTGQLIRIERVDDATRDSAVAWFASQQSARPKPKDYFIVQPLEKGVDLIVSPDERMAWRQSKIDRPTARYHFKNTDPIGGSRLAHKVFGSGGSTVVDTSTGEEIARYVSVGRSAPWHYVGLGTTGYACDAPGNWPNTAGSGLIYRTVLIPVSATQ